MLSIFILNPHKSRFNSTRKTATSKKATILITIFTAVLLSLSHNIKADPVTKDTIKRSNEILKVDSLKRTSIDTSLFISTFFAHETQRKRVFLFDSTPEFSNPYFVDASEFYRRDETAMSNALQFHPLFSEVKFGLSNSLNKSLFYGNVAPLNYSAVSGDISSKYQTLSFPVDMHNFYSTEKEYLYITNNGLTFGDFPISTPLPEIVILWENGVFGENILDIRFTRPFTRNIMLSVFSNYRHFNGTKYSHTSNNIYNFYAGFYSDTTEVSNQGYNPQTEEHTSGLQLQYTSPKGSSAKFKLTYSDQLNELAIDTFSISKEQMYEMYHRFPINISFTTGTISSRNFFYGLDFGYLNEPIIRLQPALITGTGSSLRTDGAYNLFDIGLHSGKLFNSNDSLGISLDAQNIKQAKFNRQEENAVNTDARIFYKRNKGDSVTSISLSFNGGISSDFINNTAFVLPVWHAGIDYKSKRNNIRAYIKEDNIPFAYSFDSSDNVSPSSENYFHGGTEYFYHTDKFNLLLGYQYLSEISTRVIANAWPSGVSPYSQPSSSIILAPSIGRIRGTSLATSFCLSDKKPYIKSSGRLSYIIHPMSTNEYVDINLGAEYWSERERIVFAGRSDWNKPFVNIDLDISVHILGFRLFYKIDNILNRKFAYVPGYYSSGLTFRWGFNWFIQR